MVSAVACVLQQRQLFLNLLSLFPRAAAILFTLLSYVHGEAACSFVMLYSLSLSLLSCGKAMLFFFFVSLFAALLFAVCLGVGAY